MSWRQVEHTADLALEIEAESPEALLAEGARAVIAVLTEDGEVMAREAHPVVLEAIDDEDRLVQWLNEILVLAVVEGFLTAEADIELRDDGLVANLRGEAHANNRIRTELKSVTYHDLRLEKGDDGWRAHVVIDV